jgi:hypothetical protein
VLSNAIPSPFCCATRMVYLLTPPACVLVLLCVRASCRALSASSTWVLRRARRWRRWWYAPTRAIPSFVAVPFLLCIYSHPLPLARASVRRGVVAGFVTNVQTDLAEGSTVAWGGRGDRGRTRWRRRRRVPWHGKASVQRTMRGSGDGGQRRADNGGAGITAPDKIGRRRFSSVRRPCRTQLCLRYRTQLLCKIQPCPRKLLIHVPGMYAYVPARNIVVLWESSRAAHQSTDSCARNGS